ncbi:MAG: glycosyltransferase [Synechococcaceae cyanobacterium]|nr:glycosyltransferase [Synechococcaceae cyanobacterium]
MASPTDPGGAQPRISLSMIVRDEAERLEACLNSVRGFVDEMLVLDTGSRDATIAVAERCGATVRELPWPGDFAPARNQALEGLSGDWVLVLDADEQLAAEAREPLRRLIADPQLLAITLLRQERGAVQAPYSRVSRLFRRHPQIRWSGRYHAMVDDSVTALLQREPHWRLLHWGEPALLHDGYRPELLAGSDKAQRLRAAMQAELAERPGDPYASAKLAGLELSEGRPEQAIALLQRGLARCSAQEQPLRFELLLHLAMALSGSDPLQAVTRYREALALPLEERLRLPARLNLAALLLQQGDPGAAASETEAACAAAPELALSWYNLGLIRRRLGDTGGAIEAYRRALSLNPEHPESHQNLAAALLLGGDIGGAREGIRQAIRLLLQLGRAEEAASLRQRAGSLVRLDPEEPPDA